MIALPCGGMRLDFFEQFRETVQSQPRQVGLQSITKEGRESFTYEQIAHEVGKISSFLQHSGVKPGDAVGILMENHPRWGISFLAAQSAGAIIVPFDILHEANTLTQLIQHADCKFLISSEKFFPKLQQIQKLLPNPLPSLISGASWDRALHQISDPPSLPLTRRELDEPLVIIYTSGTTGTPKGVVLTGRNVYRNMVELLKIIRLTPSDHILSVLPLHHVLALMTNFIIPLHSGAQVTYLDILEPQRILNTFQEEGITIFVCVPQFYYLVHRRIFEEVKRQSFLKKLLFQRLLRLSHFCNRNLGCNPGRVFFSPVHRKFGSQFRLFGVGGARFDPEIAESFRDLGFSVIQAYGMTETAALTTVTPPNSSGIGSVGRALPHVQLHIDQPDADGIGEVLIRGENVMKEYWKNPEETGAILSSGWLHSGDLGHLSPQGFLYITGRKKDVIVLASGKNIFPEELEHYYQSNCRFIKEMCVLGRRDTTAGSEQERLHAVIVPDFEYLKSRQVVNAYDMIRYHLENLSQQVPPYKRVPSFEIRTEPLPRTTTRKIKRFELQKELDQESPGSRGSRFAEESPAESPAEQKIFDLIRQVKTAAVVNREMHLELDLEFDSLERVELLSNLENTFRIQIPDNQAAQIFTVRELTAAVEQNLAAPSAGMAAAPLSWESILREPLDEKTKQKVHQTLRRRVVVETIFYLAAKLTYLLARLLFRLKVRETHHLPQQYPFLICPNHLSFLDPLVVCSVLPYRVVKRLFFLGYSDYFSGPVMSFWARLIKLIPVDADRRLREALRLAAEGLRQDLILCVFPEGERSIDGTLKEFRKGPAILAAEMRVPIVPAGVVGTYEVWPRGSNKIQLHPIEVSFGEPVEPSSAPESYDSLNHRLFDSVKELINQKSVDSTGLNRAL